MSQAPTNHSISLPDLRHELRTPLNAVIGYAEMLVEDCEDSGLDGVVLDLREILHAGRLLLSLLNEVLGEPEDKRGHPGYFRSLADRLCQGLISPVATITGLAEKLLLDSSSLPRAAAFTDVRNILSAAQRFRALAEEFRGSSALVLDGAQSESEAQAPLPLPSRMRAHEEVSERSDADLLSLSGSAAVLVVDDNEMNRDLLRQLVEREGHHVTEAHDGYQALQAIDERSFDLVLLDAMMPGIDGFDVAQRIRTSPHSSDLPIIMVTALASQEHRLRAVLAGANDFVSKPIDKVELRVRMASLLKMKKAVDAIKRHEAELEVLVAKRSAALVRSHQEHAHIREAFGCYVSEEIVREILASPDGVNLGGELREVSVLVADLRGFSPMTESIDSRKVLETLNRYFERMSEEIFRHSGTINEFMGDGILVFFGAPRPCPDHARRAVACSVDMQHAMVELNSKNLRDDLPRLKMGIGITSGELVVGTIGSAKRKKYTAVGSAINVAFRVEGKSRPGEILVTQAVKNKVADEVHFGSNWQENLKGVGFTTLYQVMGMLRP